MVRTFTVAASKNAKHDRGEGNNTETCVNAWGQQGDGLALARVTPQASCVTSQLSACRTVRIP